MTDETSTRALWDSLPEALRTEVDRLVTEHRPAAVIKLVRNWGLSPKPGIGTSRDLAELRARELNIGPRFD
ncbi:hypothetical protein [Amycolatopsis sp. PS_44_ISF1]|uniref:hypothetical protein n=1 Tax=Amycolatopsis sp. PS_44_ISF1 TaxID=2974917 RepID=UPI0028DD530C|nr:hypothetical protein [Amycolatopsis sp. PS_44_ISF1]MDT8911080.1 hypothetical protein [Amycolatopsis sp. PS_44_ISF1]